MLSKNFCRHFFLANFVSISLESSETYADPSFKEIVSKINFSTKNFSRKKRSQKLKMNILLNEKM